MNTRLAAATTALETLVVVAIGVGVFFAPLTLLWAIEDQFSTDLVVYWRVAADAWLLGHGVPVEVALSDAASQNLGLGPALSTFVLSLAPLGPGVLTLWWGVRMGRRDLAADFPLAVWGGGIGTVIVLSSAISLSASHPSAETPLLDAIVRPSLFLAAGLIVSSWSGKWSPGRQWLEQAVPEDSLRVVQAGVKAGVAAVASLVALSAVALALTLTLSYATVVGVFESLRPGVVGLLVLFVAQLALIPTMVVWASVWFVGPGFSLGTEALFSPLGTEVQAVPAVPVLAALPTTSVGMSVIALAVVCAVVGGALAERSLDHRVLDGLWKPVTATSFTQQPLVRVVLASVVATVTGLVALSIPAALATGSLGPGRFSAAGIDLPAFMVWWGLELFVGVLVGMLSAFALRAITARDALAHPRTGQGA